jgi:hypothetical protein
MRAKISGTPSQQPVMLALAVSPADDSNHKCAALRIITASSACL